MKTNKTSRNTINMEKFLNQRILIINYQFLRIISWFAVIVIITFSIPRMGYTAYQPPIGIPAPSFGINEPSPSLPSGWPANEVAGYYYIDKTHPSATDNSNTYGYPNKPRMTIPANQTFNGGTYIEIHGGPYSGETSSAFYYRMTFNCSNTNICWVRGASAADKPTITADFSVIGNNSYVIFENLDFNGGNGGAINITGSGNYIAIRNSSFQNRAYPGYNTAGVGITPDLGKKIHDVVIYNNLFHDLGDWQGSADTDFHGVNPSLWGRDSTTEEYNIWILENTFYHCSGNGVQVNGGNWTDSYQYLHHIYVGKNIGHDNRQAAFWSKQASHVIMSQNIAYGGRKHGSQPGDGIGYQYGPDNLWIIFNLIYDNNFGIRQSDTTTPFPDNKAYIIGNVIYNIHPESGYAYDPNDGYRPGQGIALWQGNMERFVIDNTIYDAHGGITVMQSGPVYAEGNIISKVFEQDYHITSMNATDVTYLDRNLVYQPDGVARFRWGGTTYANLSSFQSAVGQCSNCREGNPNFFNANNNDFRITLMSSAKDNGQKHEAYTTFYNLYGIDISKDFSGKPRPMGKGKIWDIGAHEFLVPSAPPNLK